MRTPVWTILFLGCSALPLGGSLPGPQGPPGIQGIQGPPGELRRLCEPDSRYCDGHLIRQCTATGADALLVNDCSIMGSDTNQGTCRASVCVRVRPLCAVELTEPLRVRGEGDGGPVTGAEPWCTITSNGDAIKIALHVPAESQPPRSFAIIVDSSAVHVGVRIELPHAAVLLGGSGVECPIGWTGSAILESGPPMVQIAVDAACTSGARLVGTFTADM